MKKLRIKAEKALSQKPLLTAPGEVPAAQTNYELGKLVYELRLHQEELEMQNLELKEAQVNLEESRKRYHELFDFAPVPYFSLDKNGIIEEANIAAVNLLGIGKKLLIKKRFQSFIHEESLQEFYVFYKKVFERMILATSEVKAKTKTGELIYLMLQGYVTPSGPGKFECKLAAWNITEKKINEEKILLLNENLTYEAQVRRLAEEERERVKKEQQKNILTAIIRTQEDERKRIAESLHNDLGQLLYVAKLKMQNNIKDEAEKLISKAITRVRTISFELMPTILQDYGLDTAMKDLIDKRIKPENINLKYTNTAPCARYCADIEITVFRIVQEMFNNMVKYSKATKARLDIKNTVEHLLIEFNDNGVGFNAEEMLKRNKGFGLKSIKSKVELYNGTFNITSEKDKGTNIKVIIPVS